MAPQIVKKPWSIGDNYAIAALPGGCLLFGKHKDNCLGPKIHVYPSLPPASGRGWRIVWHSCSWPTPPLAPPIGEIRVLLDNECKRRFCGMVGVSDFRGKRRVISVRTYREEI